MPTISKPLRLAALPLALLAGAEKVFVGPATGLTGPPDVVAALPNHDNHLHVRIPAALD